MLKVDLRTLDMLNRTLNAFVRLCSCVSACMLADMRAGMYSCLCVCVRACVSACMLADMRAGMYSCLCVCVRACVHACMCVCVHVIVCN